MTPAGDSDLPDPPQVFENVRTPRVRRHPIADDGHLGALRISGEVAVEQHPDPLVVREGRVGIVGIHLAALTSRMAF